MEHSEPKDIVVPLPNDHPFSGEWTLVVHRDKESTTFTMNLEDVPPGGVSRGFGSLQFALSHFDEHLAPSVIAQEPMGRHLLPAQSCEKWALKVEDWQALRAEKAAADGVKPYHFSTHGQYIYECQIDSPRPFPKNAVAVAEEMAKRTDHLLTRPCSDVVFLFPRPQGDPLRLYATRDALVRASPFFEDLFTSGFSESTITSDNEDASQRLHTASSVSSQRASLDEDLDDADLETDEQLAFPSQPASLPATSIALHEVVVTDTAYTTYHALLSYLRTDFLAIAPLTTYEASNSTILLSCPVSLFRLAHYLRLPGLQRRCLEAIKHTLEPSTVALKLLKPSTRLYEELQQVVIECVVKNVWKFKRSEAWDEVMGKFGRGEAAEAAPVMVTLLSAMASAIHC
ncbi:hypothetical protein JCM10213v2_000226 [Rhodosporidiobolus nylandii]